MNTRRLQYAQITTFLAALFILSPFQMTFSLVGGVSLADSTAIAASGPGKAGDGGSDDDDDDDDDHDHDDDDDDDDDDGGDEYQHLGSPDVSDNRQSDTATVPDILKIEITPSGVIIIYRNGSRETLENGVYTRMLSNGQLAESRKATGADLAHFRAIVKRSSGSLAVSPTDIGSSARPVRIVMDGRRISVEYSNGWIEEISDGQYRLTDKYGRRVIARKATAQDRARLRALADG